MIAARPLRFVAAVLAVWTGTRVWILWPGVPLAPEPLLIVSGSATRAPIASTAPAVAVARDAPPSPRAVPKAATLLAETLQMPVPAATPHSGMSDPDRLLAYARGGSPLLAMLSLAGARTGLAAVATPDPRAPSSPKSGRLSGYGWIFARAGGGTPGLADGGQLGGSQAGLRLDYALAPGFALTGRISAPLETRLGREAAVGLNWKPARNVPLSFTVERRIALGDGGRNAFAAMAAGGIGPVELPASFTLEAYGQAGVVGLKRRDGFVDGAVTMTRPMADADGLKLSLGAGAWGAAQPGVSRLDIGPRVKLRFDTGATSIGAAIDWRQRIAGNAMPRSGIAVTLDGSF